MFLSLCRYVNARGEVIERFLGLREVADTSSSSLKMALDGMLASHAMAELADSNA
jgi:hypothetical protein